MKSIVSALLLLSSMMSASATSQEISNGEKNMDNQVLEKAMLAVAQMNGRAGGNLNYSEASIQAVEELAAEAARYSKDLDQDTIESLTQLLGSYILEVAHRKYGGSYMWYEPQKAPLLVVGEPKYSIAIATFEKVRGRISGDSSDNLGFFYQGFSERVQSAKPGDNVLYK